MTLKFRPVKIAKRALIAYALICLFMFCFQRRLLYMPYTHIQPPQAYGLQDFQVLRLTDKDGTHVQAWYRKAAAGYPTIVHFHGNGGHLGARAYYFALLSDAHFGVLALDYRGYGSSEGSPSEEGFYEDARATLDYAAHVLGLKPQQIIIYGESIGTGVAVQMASEYREAALVLQSPYTSMVQLAHDNYPWLPVSLLLKDRFDSIDKIQNIHCPLLVMHGEADTIVPVKYGRILFDRAPEPKDAVYFPGAGHNNMDMAAMTKVLLAFSQKYRLINTH